MGKLNRKRFCLCGCGQIVNLGRKYIQYHNRRGKKLSEKQILLMKEAQNRPEMKLLKSKIHKNKKLSAEHIQRIKEANKGNQHVKGKNWKLSEESKMNYRKPHVLSEIGRQNILDSQRNRIRTQEERDKISRAAKLRTGDKNPNWQGGVSFLPYPAEWNKKFKEEIIKSFNGICQLCGVDKEIYESNNKMRFAVHHIDYDKSNMSKENLIPLCGHCHNLTSQKSKRIFWTNYFNNKLKEVA